MCVAECDMCGQPVMMRGSVAHVEYRETGRYAREGDVSGPDASAMIFPICDECECDARHHSLAIIHIDL